MSDPDTLLVHVIPPKVDETADAAADAEGGDGAAEAKGAPAADAEG